MSHFPGAPDVRMHLRVAMVGRPVDLIGLGPHFTTVIVSHSLLGLRPPYRYVRHYRLWEENPDFIRVLQNCLFQIILLKCPCPYEAYVSKHR